MAPAEDAIPAGDAMLPPARLRVGVSACLLGEKVRFDGQHKRDGYVVDELGKYVDWVPVCPELEVGMGVPREAVRLLRDRASLAIRMVGVKSGDDWTARMERFSAARVKMLVDQDLAGFILKAKSPSCGMARVKLYDAEDPRRAPETVGAGLFAAALAARLPNLPVEEEGRLSDARLRENFIERLFAHARLRALGRGRWTMGALVAFHTAHKMALLAHSTDGYRALGKLVGEGKSLPRRELRERYESGFMRTLARPTTPGKHANVLMHLFGHVSDQIDEGDRREVLQAIEGHRTGRTPLVVPLTLLAHHARRANVRYLQGQIYLHPRGDELSLRNRV